MADFHGDEGPDRLVKRPALALKPISNVLGPNATLVLNRIKLALDLEPKLTSGFDNLLSNDWVLWHMRQTGAPRVVALNRGFAKLEDKQFSINRKSPPFGKSEDPVLKILGVSRPEFNFNR